MQIEAVKLQIEVVKSDIALIGVSTLQKPILWSVSPVSREISLLKEIRTGLLQ